MSHTRGVYMMTKKLTGNELAELLIRRNESKYRYELYILKNVGNPDLAITEMWGYSIDNDIVIVSPLPFLHTYHLEPASQVMCDNKSR